VTLLLILNNHPNFCNEKKISAPKRLDGGMIFHYDAQKTMMREKGGRGWDGRGRIHKFFQIAFRKTMLLKYKNTCT